MIKNKFLKIKQYFNEFGFKKTVKRFFVHIDFKLKSEIRPNYKNEYKVKRKYKKNIVAKTSEKYVIISRVPYHYNNGKHISAYYAKILNEMGYLIEYLYLDVDGNHKNERRLVPPTVKHQKLRLNNEVKLKKSDNIIIEVSLEKTLLNYLPSKVKLINDYNHEKVDEKNIYDDCLEIIKVQDKQIDGFINNISIIVLNYNNKNIISTCIDSLLEYKGRYNYEIIVVDNQSSDGSYEELINKHNDKIKLVRNIKNGCSSGRNLGVGQSTKKYIMFLDSDQWVLNDFWLDNYLQVIKTNPEIGAIGWAAGWFNKEGYAEQIADNFPYRYMPPYGLYRYDIGYLGTGGMLLTRELFNEIGGFDLFYDPTCYEDTDISLKIRNTGRKIVYCPYLGIKHLPHQTTKSGTDFHEKLIKEKGIYFVSKWKNKNPQLLRNEKYRK